MLRFAVTLAAVATTATPLALRSTPYGARPRNCIFKVPSGSIVRDLPGRAFSVQPPHAEAYYVEVPKECDEFAAQTWEQLPRAGVIPDGWINNAGAYYTAPGDNTHLNKFTGKWNVPAAPVSPKKPETLYWFIGLEDRSQGSLTSILQPVLTWGDETEGGVGGWHLWSWACCPKNVSWHSEDINGFKTGDTIYGSIEKVSDSTWVIDSAFQDSGSIWHNTTLKAQVGNFDYNYADVTLEVYNVTGCEQIAQGAVSFRDLKLSLNTGGGWKPATWYTNGMETGCQANTKIIDVASIDISVGQ